MSENINTKLQTMFQLQDEMNKKVHENWQQQGFEWYRAIWIECAELMDHHGWKWWKKQDPNRDQVVLEVIDIWHFGLSIVLQEQNQSVLSTKVTDFLQNPIQCSNFLSSVEDFAGACLAKRSFDADKFLIMMVGADLSFDELYQRYVGKNVLNSFRQDHGYKTGEYKKIWGSKEDNEHLVELIQELDHAAPDFRNQLYQALETRYQAY